MVGISDLAAAKEAVEQMRDKVDCQDILVRDDIAEVSVVGVGMRSHCGVAEKMFDALAKAEVNIDSITTSEIRISCAVDEDQAEKALEAVCVVFELDKAAVHRSK
jgi:aspartate kinase